MRDVVRRWCLVTLPQTECTLHLHDEIVLDEVLGLNGVLEEDGVTLDIVECVILNSQVVCALDCNTSVEGSPHRVASDVRLVSVSELVEVDGEASPQPFLAHIPKQYVFDPSN